MREPPPVLPALITPFDQAGEIVADDHRHNLRTLSQRGIDGFVIGGSTGLGPYLEEGEREKLVGIARDEVGTDPFLICGVAAESTRAGLHQIREIERGGADAALVMTPTTLVRGQARLVGDYYRRIANEADIPVFLYSVPAVTGFELPVPTVIDLARHPNIVGLKDSGGDPTRVPLLHEPIRAGFFIFAGASRAVAESARSGAWGGITSSANYAASLVRGAVTGDEPSNAALLNVSKEVESYGVGGTYAAAELAGLASGYLRAPLAPLPTGARAAVDRALSAAGLIAA